MNKLFWHSLLVSSAVIGASFVTGADARAAELDAEVPALDAQQLAQSISSPDANLMGDMFNYANEGAPASLNQVQSVNQLTDISPSDWAFQAVKNMVERYQCLEGYPDQTFRGNRPVTRFEFAAALNACLDRVLEIVGGGEGVSPEDFATLRALVEEFEGELAVLRGRVDDLEARTAQLEATQFSTTTKLRGETIFLIADNFGDTEAGSDDNTVFQYRVRLNFDTSFTGEDLLLTRLQVGQAGSSTFSFAPAGALTTDYTANTGGTFLLDSLLYFFPIGENITTIVSANVGIWDDVAPTLNPALEDFEGGNGSLSLFGQRNPIYRIGGGAGLGFQGQFGAINVAVGYLADRPSDPSEKQGLFNGDFAALGQIALLPESGKFGIGATYVRGYHTTGNAIYDNAFGVTLTGTSVLDDIAELGAQETNTVGISGFLQLGEKFTISAWGGYTDVQLAADSDADDDIWNYAVTLSLSDVGSEGSLLGVVVGAPPYLGGALGEIPIHVEGFYKYQINDNINITPGLIYVANPQQIGNDDDLFIGVLRTTFNF